MRPRGLGPDREPPLGRRELLARLATVTVGLVAIPSRVTAAEPPPETTRLRMHHNSQSLCLAPQYVAEDLLRGEGDYAVQAIREVGGSSR